MARKDAVRKKKIVRSTAKLTTLDNFLAEEGKRDEFEAIAVKEVLAWQIEQAMNGNLCRCATYNRIKSAIRQAAGLTPALAEAPAPRQVLADASTDHKA